PTFLVTGTVEGFGCTPMDCWVGRAVRPTSSGVTLSLPRTSGCPVCAFSRGVTDPVCPVACWPGVRLFPRCVRGGKHAEEHEQHRNGSPCEQKERTASIAAQFAPIRNLVF